MIPIFLSTPNSLSQMQSGLKDCIVTLVKGENLEPRTIGITDMPTSHPLKEAAILARACYGGLILGFEQCLSQMAVQKRGTLSEKAVHGLLHPTPWNQLEAGMLFALRKPLLIMRQPGVEGGIFDPGVSESFIVTLPTGQPTELEERNIASVVKSWASEVAKSYRHWG